MRTALVLCLLAAACGPGPAPSRSLTVSGGFIRDPEGRVLTLRGANVASAHKFPPFFDFQEGPDFERMRAEWGMNTVRFLITWAAVEPEAGTYDDAYLRELARRVRAASDAGLYVFVDMHQDLYGLGFPGGDGFPAWTCDAAQYAAFTPTTPWFFNYLSPQVTACVDGFWGSRDLQARYAAAWGQVAGRLADVPRFVGVDPMNEPYWGSTPADVLEVNRLAPLYSKVLAEVRQHKGDLLGFLEPAVSRNLGLPTHLPAFSEPGIVYAPHSYDGDAERGFGFNASHRPALLEQAQKLEAEAEALGAALVVGEYGGVAAQGGIGAYMEAQYDAFTAVSAGATYWAFGRDDQYGLLNPDGSDKPELLDAVARPYAERTAGTPRATSFDAATRTFTYAWVPDPALAAPTELSIPARTWPEGYQVDCDACLPSASAHGVALYPAHNAELITVTLRPRG